MSAWRDPGEPDSTWVMLVEIAVHMTRLAFIFMASSAGFHFHHYSEAAFYLLIVLTLRFELAYDVWNRRYKAERERVP